MFPKKKRLIELDIPIQRNIVRCFKLIYDQQENIILSLAYLLKNLQTCLQSVSHWPKSRLYGLRVALT